jgi:hypothetical protein
VISTPTPGPKNPISCALVEMGALIAVAPIKPSASSACVIVRVMQSLKLSFARPGFMDAYNNVNARGLAKFLLAVRFCGQASALPLAFDDGSEMKEAAN